MRIFKADCVSGTVTGDLYSAVDYGNKGGWIQSLVTKLARSTAGSGKPGGVIGWPAFSFLAQERLSSSRKASGSASADIP